MSKFADTVNKFSDMSGEERPNDISDDLPYVIVTAQSMDYDLIRTVPSALSGAATGLGYSHDALVVLSITQYIRNLGYHAVASMNDSALAIPLAVKAGLGECADTNTIGFVFIAAREIYLLLRGRALRDGDAGLHRVTAAAGSTQYHCAKHNGS